jgi:large subunit ribosomal protein L22
MKASLKNARISPKKINLIAGLVRGQKAQIALDRLMLTPKKGAKLLHKVVASAVANASNNLDQKIENLFIKSIIVNKGVTFKRGIPISRGRYHPILKRNSNVTVEIGVVAGAETKNKASKKTTETGSETVEQNTNETISSEKTPKSTKKAPRKTTSKKAKEAPAS